MNITYMQLKQLHVESISKMANLVKNADCETNFKLIQNLEESSWYAVENH